MNAELIRRWNNKVGVNDTVFYLGDLTFRKKIEKYFVNQLNGKIHFIYTVITMMIELLN
jgi:calcineurin-like phosphoesterase family protein